MQLLKHLEHPVFGLVSEISGKLGAPAYVVGGYVRDALLDKDCKDVDIVCVGSGIALAEAVSSRLPGASGVSVYKNFGTASITAGGFHIEFVGARKESYSPESRNPAVQPGTLQDDFNRRDFTINAMAISLNRADYGQLVDPFGGLRDLSAGVIQTPLAPGITFSDDPLRMLRAVRFASQLGFHIREETFSAIREYRERIRIVSQERVSDELNKIVLATVPSAGFKLLFDAGILHIVFPELVALQGVENVKGQGHKDNFYHTLKVLDNVAAAGGGIWLRWAALLHDIAKPATKRFDPQEGWTFHGHDAVGARMVPRIFKRLRLPLDEKMKLVQKLVALHLRPIGLAKENVTDSGIRRLLFEAGDCIDELMTLCRADITSKNEMKVQRFLRNFDHVEIRLKKVEEKDRIRNWQPPVTGEEIMRVFNIKPSEQIGIIKNAIREAILDGEIPNTYEAAYEYMLMKGRELGLETHDGSNHKSQITDRRS